MKLTTKQRKFVEWYVHPEVAGNATEAAVKAGYGGTRRTLSRTGAALLKKAHIAEAIEAKAREITAASDISIESVLRGVKRVLDMATEKEQLPSALKALEMQGKYLAMWTERIEHVRSLEDVSTEEPEDELTRVMERLEPEDKQRLKLALTAEGTTLQ